MKIETLYSCDEPDTFEPIVERRFSSHDSQYVTLKQLNDHLYIETILQMAPPSSDGHFVGNEYFVG
jgi:hypothetical protein